MAEAGTTLSLATVRRREEDWTQAIALACDALRLYQAMGHAIGRTESWLNLADTAAAQGEWEAAAQRFSAAETCRSAPPVAEEIERHDSLHASLCAQLTPKALAAALERGKTLTCDAYGLR